MIRGRLTGRYPYPFLNPVNGRYGTVALYCVAILVFMLVLSGAVVWLGNVRRGQPALARRAETGAGIGRQGGSDRSPSSAIACSIGPHGRYSVPSTTPDLSLQSAERPTSAGRSNSGASAPSKRG
jgi:hypothetical protein